MLIGEITHNTHSLIRYRRYKKILKEVNLDLGKRKYPSHFNAGNIYLLYDYSAHTDTVNELGIIN